MQRHQTSKLSQKQKFLRLPYIKVGVFCLVLVLGGFFCSFVALFTLM